MGPRKKFVEAWVDLFSRQDWDAMLELVTDDVERHEVGAPERIRGKEAFRQHIRPGPDVARMRSTISRMTEEGNVLVAEGTVELTLKDGRSIDILCCNIFELEGEKVRRQTSYTDVEPASE